MKRAIIFAGLAVLALASCKKNVEPGKDPVDFSQYKVRVEPVITRVTETNFEAGDAIGLSIIRKSGDYATNVQMKYDGTAFSGDLNWYDDGEEASTIKAYYPYKEGEGLPTMFSVQQDQSKGTAASDFVSAVKENVLPSANAVAVVFKHQLSLVVTTVDNKSGADIESIVFEEFVPQAHIAADLTAKVVDGAKWQPLTPFFKNDKYYLIVPAQTVKPVVKVTVGGKTLTQELTEVSLEPGKLYTVPVEVYKDKIKVVLAGDIENWNDGGEIGGGPSFSENLEEGYFTYADVKYNVVKMKDGKWWMAQNLAYLPEGCTPATDLTSVSGRGRPGPESRRPHLRRGRHQAGSRPGHLPEGLARSDAAGHPGPGRQVLRSGDECRRPVLQQWGCLDQAAQRGRLQHGGGGRHLHPGQHEDQRHLHGLHGRLQGPHLLRHVLRFHLCRGHLQHQR